jgi:uncharacterized protein (DUF433 family)
MSAPGLEDFSKDQLIEELINRQTFVGIVIFHRGDAKSGRVEPGEFVMTKSPPLTREGVETLLQLGQSLVCGMFADQVSPGEASDEGLALVAERPPLRVDEGGAVRVGKTRISLDLIVEQFENGMTPEDMTRAYDTLTLADAYAAVAYYLRHRDQVRAYLERREAEAQTLRAKIETDRPRMSRETLLARRSAGERADAATGE